MNVDYKNFQKKLMLIVKILLNSMTLFEIDKKIHNHYKYWYLLFTFATSISIISSQLAVYLHATCSYEKFLAIQSTGAIFSSNSIFLASQFRSKCLVDIYFMIKNGTYFLLSYKPINFIRMLDRG